MRLGEIWLFGLVVWLVCSTYATAAPKHKAGETLAHQAQKRLKLARKGYQMSLAHFKRGMQKVQDVCGWSLRLLRSQQALLRVKKKLTHANKLGFLKNHQRRLRILFKVAEARVKRGSLGALALLDLRYHLEEAKLWLRAHKARVAL